MRASQAFFTGEGRVMRLHGTAFTGEEVLMSFSQAFFTCEEGLRRHDEAVLAACLIIQPSLRKWRGGAGNTYRGVRAYGWRRDVLQPLSGFVLVA